MTYLAFTAGVLCGVTATAWVFSHLLWPRG